VDFASDGKTVATGGGDGAVYVWDASTNPPQLLQRMLGHTSYVYDVAMSPDGKSVASTGWDKSVRIWDVKTGLQRRYIATQTDGYAIAYRPDGKQLAVGMSSGEARVYEAGETQLETPMQGKIGSAIRMVISADNRRLLVCGAHGELSSWETRSGNCIFREEDRNAVHASDVSQNGTLAVRVSDASWSLISATDGTVMRTGAIERDGAIKSVSISNNGEVMAVLSNTVKVYDTRSGHVIAKLPAKQYDQSLVLSPDGSGAWRCGVCYFPQHKAGGALLAPGSGLSCAPAKERWQGADSVGYAGC
jgi:WD40 repeat protein